MQIQFTALTHSLAAKMARSFVSFRRGGTTGYNLFNLQAVEFIASRQQAAAETAI
jgi:hypothetical protein